MNLEKQKDFLVKFAYITVILGLGYVAIKYLVPALLPFVIGMIIAVIFKGPIGKISQHTKVKRPIVAILVLIIFYIVLAIVLFLFGAQLISLGEGGISKIPGLYNNTIEPFLVNAIDNIISKIPQAETQTIELSDIVDNLIGSVSTFVTSATSTILAGIASIATKLPSLIINSIFTVVSSFFFTIDYHDITDFVFRQLPEKRAIQARNIKSDVIGTVWKYIKSYAFLMLVTFVELTIGMLIFGVANPLAVAALIAVIDILPVLGTGTVLIPWAIVGFIFNDYKIGFGMIILYLVITAVRQTLEPKIIGKQIGLHPVVTLIGIFVGAKLFGLIGMFLLPITITILKQMNDEGAIHLFK